MRSTLGDSEAPSAAARGGGATAVANGADYLTAYVMLRRAMSSAADASRAAMFAQVASGGGAAAAGDARAAGSVVLGRGCDAVMARQSAAFLPPLIGGATVLPFSDDDAFFAALAAVKAGTQRAPDVVFFAPGAHRWAEAGQPIPGGNAVSRGWGLKEYHAHVRAAVGPGVPIVGSAREAEMVPLLRAALKLDAPAAS